MMMRRLGWLLAFLLAFSPASAVTTARYSTTLLAKESGTSRAVLLRSASVYVFNIGATVSTTASATQTLTVYDSSTIQDADVLEVSSSGLTATVTDVPSATTITVDTALTVTAGDRLLRTNSTVTIYSNEGGTSTITQPATSDSSGRVTFFVNASATNTFDVKAVSTAGLRFVDYAVALAGGGSGGGGWSDDGTVVRLTTATDKVGIGTSSPNGSLELQQTISAGTNPTPFGGSPASPTTLFNLHGLTSAPAEVERYFYWMDNTGDVFLRLVGASKDVHGIRNGAYGEQYFGDVANMDSSTFGQMNVRPGSASRRGLVISGATSQSANLLELRDGNEVVKASVSPAGNALFAGTLNVTGAASLASTVTSLSHTVTGNMVASGSVQGASATVTGSSVTINGVAYTFPNTDGTGSKYLKNDGSGVLSWDIRSSANCFQMVNLAVPKMNSIAGLDQSDGWTTTDSGIAYLAIQNGGMCSIEDDDQACGALDFWDRFYPSHSGTISGFRAIAASNNGASSSTYALYKNGSEVLSCAITSGTASCSDVDTVTYTSSDYLFGYVDLGSVSVGSSGVISFCLVTPE